ncbi:MAG TPA: hypothetical protein VGG57_02170 [Stellaceae bacterium]|jgi:hypothetical protein
MTAIGERSHYSTAEGTWLSIAADAEEAVRVFVPRQPHMGLAPASARSLPDVTVALWWPGASSPAVVGDWVRGTIGGHAELECRLTVWADDAPGEARSYQTDSIGRIASDIAKWADDGAVACSIGPRAQHEREVVYLWTELKTPNADHSGEVGLQYAGLQALATGRGRQGFAFLHAHTAVKPLADDGVEQLCELLLKAVPRYIGLARAAAAF